MPARFELRSARALKRPGQGFLLLAASCEEPADEDRLLGEEERGSIVGEEQESWPIDLPFKARGIGALEHLVPMLSARTSARNGHAFQVPDRAERRDMIEPVVDRAVLKLDPAMGRERIELHSEDKRQLFASARASGSSRGNREDNCAGSGSAVEPRRIGRRAQARLPGTRLGSDLEDRTRPY